MVQVLIKKFLLFTYLALFSFSVHADQPIKSIMIFGDSLSAAYGIDYQDGWVSLLEKRLASEGYDVKVINASISGNTSGNGRSRIKNDLKEHNPDLLILELGGNDGLRGHPPKRLKENLRAMIELSRASGTEVLLVGMQLPPSYGKRYTTAFANIYPELAKELSVPLVESFIDTVGVDLSLMQNDRIHPNEKGQPLLLNNVWPQLKKLLDQSS